MVSKAIKAATAAFTTFSLIQQVSGTLLDDYIYKTCVTAILLPILALTEGWLWYPTNAPGTDFELDDTWERLKDFDILASFASIDEQVEIFTEDQCMGAFKLRTDAPEKDIPYDGMKECCRDLGKQRPKVRITGASGDLLPDRPDEFDNGLIIGGMPGSCTDLIWWLNGEGKVVSSCGHRCVRYDLISDMEYNEIKCAIVEYLDSQEKQVSEKASVEKEAAEKEAADNEFVDLMAAGKEDN